MGKKRKDYGFRPFEGPGIRGKHLRITNFMMESAAWKDLTIHSIALYVHIKAKFNYSNEDNISFTYAEGERLMNKRTFTKSIDQLIDLGFIKIVRQGWTTREPNIYGFSDQWQRYGLEELKISSRSKRATSRGKIDGT